MGVLFGGMMVVFYGVKFLLDNRIKSVDELARREGLHLIALLAGKKRNEKRFVVDKLIETKLEYNSDGYLRSPIEASGVSRI